MSAPNPIEVADASGTGVRPTGDSRLTPEGRAALLALIEDDGFADFLDATGDAMNDLGALS